MQPIGPAQYEGSQGSETSSDFTSSSFHADGNRSFLCSLLCARSATSFFFKVAPKFTSLFLGQTCHLSLSSHHQTGLVSPFLRFTCNSIIKISVSPNKVPKLQEHFPLSHHFLSPPPPTPQAEDQAPQVWSTPTPQAQEIHCREHSSPETFEGRLNSILSPHVSGNALKFPPVYFISFLIHP